MACHMTNNKTTLKAAKMAVIVASAVGLRVHLMMKKRMQLLHKLPSQNNNNNLNNNLNNNTAYPQLATTAVGRAIPANNLIMLQDSQ